MAPGFFETINKCLTLGYRSLYTLQNILIATIEIPLNNIAHYVKSSDYFHLQNRMLSIQNSSIVHKP